MDSKYLYAGIPNAIQLAVEHGTMDMKDEIDDRPACIDGDSGSELLSSYSKTLNPILLSRPPGLSIASPNLVYRWTSVYMYWSPS